MYLGVTSIHPIDLAGDLSVWQQQMLEIARALSTKAKLIVMDEPTAALTDREIESLFKMVASLRKKGVSIIYISHRMEEIFEICDRIDRKSTRLNSSHVSISYAVFCLIEKR